MSVRHTMGYERRGEGGGAKKTNKKNQTKIIITNRAWPSPLAAS